MKQLRNFLPDLRALRTCSTHEWKRSAGIWRVLLSPSRSVYAIGTVLPFAITCLVLYRAGVFKKFWFWTFSYARTYASERGFPAKASEYLSVRMRSAVGSFAFRSCDLDYCASSGVIVSYVGPSTAETKPVDFAWHSCCFPFLGSVSGTLFPATLFHPLASFCVVAGGSCRQLCYPAPW